MVKLLSSPSPRPILKDPFLIPHLLQVEEGFGPVRIHGEEKIEIIPLHKELLFPPNSLKNL
jgi:hypothetical protein